MIDLAVLPADGEEPHPSPFHASDPLLAAAQLALTQSGDDIGLSDEEVVPYINALRIVHGDDHSAVAAYDRARLTDSGALRSAKARLRKCPTDRNLVTVEEFAAEASLLSRATFAPKGPIAPFGGALVFP